MDCLVWTVNVAAPPPQGIHVLRAQSDRSLDPWRPHERTADGLRDHSLHRAWVNEEPPVGNVRFALALTMAFQDFLEPGKAIAFLESHRRAHIARLAQYRTYEEKTVEKDFALWSTVRLGIRYEQSIVDWIDEVGAEFARRSRATSGSKKAASKKTAPKKAASKKAASKKAARR